MGDRQLTCRARRFLVHSALHLHDTPHRIALGAAVGIFVAWTPTFGVQMLLAMLLAFVLGANKAATLPFVWITNPLTHVPIYWCNYKLGRFLICAGTGRGGAGETLPTLAGQGLSCGSLDAGFWKRLMPELLSVGVELWFGSLILGTILAGIGYLLVRQAVQSYRLHKAHPTNGPGGRDP